VTPCLFQPVELAVDVHRSPQAGQVPLPESPARPARVGAAPEADDLAIIIASEPQGAPLDQVKLGHVEALQLGRLEFVRHSVAIVIAGVALWYLTTPRVRAAFGRS